MKRSPPLPAHQTGDTDTFLIGEAMEQYPELKQVSSCLIPDGAQREDDGTGSGAGGAGGADRRAATKREGDRLNELNRAGKKQVKKEKVAQGIVDATKEVMKAAVAEMTPLQPALTPADTKWRQKTHEAKSKSAAITFSNDLVKVHTGFSNMLKEGIELGEAGSAAKKAFLTKKIASLEKAMEEEY